MVVLTFTGTSSAPLIDKEDDINLAFRFWIILTFQFPYKSFCTALWWWQTDCTILANNFQIYSGSAKNMILNLLWMGFPFDLTLSCKCKCKLWKMQTAQHQQSLLDNAALDIFTRILQHDDHPCDLSTLWFSMKTPGLHSGAQRCTPGHSSAQKMSCS